MLRLVTKGSSASAENSPVLDGASRRTGSTMVEPLSQEQVHLLCLIGLVILAIGAGWGHKFREFLHLVREALYDEWQRPR